MILIQWREPMNMEMRISYEQDFIKDCGRMRKLSGIARKWQIISPKMLMSYFIQFVTV